MSVNAKSQMASKGVFEFFRQDVSNVKGSGPNGERLFSDLWEVETGPDGETIPMRGADGNMIAKAPIVESRIVNNKFTRRGLGRMLHVVLQGHGGTYTPPEVTHSATTSPFAAFMMFSDDTANAKAGDARVEFDESDGQFDTLLSPSSAVVGEGRRGITLSDTSGILKRVAVTYRGTNPYSVLEYVFYAQPNTVAVETGDDGIDNFPIKACGLAAGVACGDGEASSFIGVRAIVGLPPLLQGVSDRLYQHEGQQNSEDLVANEYVIDESDVGAVAGNAGYLQSSKLAEVQIDSTSTPSGAVTDSIVAATRVITLANAATDFPTTSGFDAAAHTRKLLRIAASGTAGNNRDYTIQEVIGATSVKVFESPAADDDGSLNPFTASIYESYEGHNAFDGRVENEGRVETSDTGTVPVPNDAPGVVEYGEKWVSEDSAGTHTIGRVFASTVNNLTGIRICLPQGVNKSFVPNNFTIQVLDPTANGGSPRPGYSPDWVTVSSGAKTSQGTTLYDTGIYGVEYTFDAINARGVRLTAMQAVSSSRYCQIAELMAFTYIQSGNEIELSNNNLRVKVKAPDSYRQHELEDTAATTSVQTIVDTLNQAFRGYQIEARRSQFGFLWLRGSVAGNNSDVYLDAENVDGANTDLGFPAIATQRTGITQPITKVAADAMTIIYKLWLYGDVPGGPA